MSDTNEHESPKEPSAQKNPSRFGLIITIIIFTWTPIIGIPAYVYVFHKDEIAHIASTLNTSAPSEELLDQIEQKFILLENKIEELDAQKVTLPPSLPEPAPEKTIKEEPVKNAVPENKQTEPITFKNVQSEKQPPTQATVISDPLEKETISAGLTEISERTVALEEEIYKLNHEVKNATSNDNFSTLILAIINLIEATKTGQPYKEELGIITLNIPEDSNLDDDIQTLKLHQTASIPTVQTLQANFNNVIDKILHAERQSKPNPSFMDKASLMFSDVISIRKIGSDALSNETEDILARTETFLNQYNIKASIEEIKKLSDKTAPLAKNWVSDAEKHIAVKEASEKIFDYITTQVYQTKHKQNS